MKKIFSLLFLIAIAQIAKAAPVDSLEAAKIANNFYRQNNTSGVVNGVPVKGAKSEKKFRDVTPKGAFKNIYIFSADDGGFVIVSADDRAVPVLGYSDDGFVNADSLPDNFKWWLGEYEREIGYAIENDIPADVEVKEEWVALRAGQPVSLRDAKGVTPLLQTTWNQSPYYNIFCPYDPNAEDYAVTGCVATAMAQIMKYWEYPVVGQGDHIYADDYFGPQYANFATNLFWNNMPVSLDASSSFMQMYSVAKLMRLCGVSVDMDYGVNGSGAKSIKVANAMIKYFNYSSSAKIVAKDDYTSTAWQSLLKNELNNGRPMLYAGSDPNSGGHAFVCDGVSNSNNFHFNWGWGGTADGYFSLSALNPGADNYSTFQCAVIGIEPAHPVAKPTYDLVMNSTLSTDASTYAFGEDVVVTRSIKNNGLSTFSGYINVMLCDMQDNVIDYRQNYVTIPANGTNTASVTFYGDFPLVPGDYYVTVTSMTDKNDVNTLRLVRDDGSHENFALIEVQNSAPIETYSAFSYSALHTGQSATVSVKLKNDVNSSFTGTVALVIYDLSGNFEQNLGQKTISNLSAYGTYTVNLTPTISVSAGEHFLVAIYKPSGSSDWYYAGSSYYSNPLRVYVEGSLSPDIYEADNSAATAYNLGAVSLDYEKFDIGANFHNSTDKDFYKILLPTGYEYQVNTKIFDSYNEGGGFCSVDAKFALSTDGVSWSADYDDTLYSYFIGDSVLYFRVLPYTSGDMGTYRLNIEVFRYDIILPDQYEDNNTAMTAYNLATINSASQNIPVSANFHVVSDEDYYKIILPAGYDYTVNATIYTSYNSSSYTADAKFATSADGTNWSNNYGTQMPALTISGSAILFFRVLPYTVDELGTYKLDINVQRTQAAPPALQPDQYENNNSASTSYLLTTVNSNSSQVSAVANFHEASDVDFYKVHLPAGYEYAVNATLYSGANSTSYTAMASFSTSTNGTAWTGNYTGQMPEMTLNGGVNVFFRVTLNSDEPGTYKLVISVTRKNLVSISENSNLNELFVYPNPATDVLNIAVPNCVEIESVDLLNIDGQLVRSYRGNVKSLNVGDLSSGIYFIRIITSEGVATRKWGK